MGYSHFRHFQNCCNRDENTIFKYMNYVPIIVATDLEVHFSVLKKGVSQYFVYIVYVQVIQFPRISLYALTLRFVLIEITKVVKPVH